MAIVYVIIGGGLGAALRYGASVLVPNYIRSNFPFGTLAVNLAGAFLIGLIMTLGEFYEISFSTKLFLVTGILGGFTTFSAYTLETFYLFKTGDFSFALLNVMVSNILGLGFVYAGYLVGRFFAS